MPGLSDLQYDVASAVSLGQRDIQEDAIICDFPIGSPLGFAVLSDGMGGHAAGDIASKIVVTEVFSELKLQSGNSQQLETDIAEILLGAAMAANDCIYAHVESEPGTDGMGATLIAPVLMDDHLYWISVGDSPLMMYRDGALSQLNEDHSMAPQIDFLARTGLMEAETALYHPDRNCLTSVLSGQEIARVDCPPEPMQLMDGDIIIAASDGLQFLDDAVIANLLAENIAGTSTDISASLLNCLKELDDPDQDNVSFCVIKVHLAEKKTDAAKVPSSTETQVTTEPALSEAQPSKGKVTIMASASQPSQSLFCGTNSERRA